MDDALRLAERALARRELTAEELRRRLRRAGVSEETIDRTLSRLAETGYLSEERAASERARVLCRRGYGDAFLRADLKARGAPAEAVEAALAALPPEEERAAAAWLRLGGGAEGLRALRRRGFSEETVERVAGSAVADRP